MKKTGTTLYCFSPPVMIATFIIELATLLYTVIRYRFTPLTRVIAVILLLLAVFQLAEYNVCGNLGLSADAWSRIGYVAITLLPALSIHLIMIVSRRHWQWLVWLSYLTAAGFALLFGLSQSAFANHVCSGNYVIFHLVGSVGRIYFVYYYAWLIIGIFLGLYLSVNASKKIRTALILQVVGYLSFLLPTAVVNTVNPRTISGIPSIMCGFAIIYALILVFGVAPLMLPKRARR